MLQSGTLWNWHSIRHVNREMDVFFQIEWNVQWAWKKWKWVACRYYKYREKTAQLALGDITYTKVGLHWIINQLVSLFIIKLFFRLGWYTSIVRHAVAFSYSHRNGQGEKQIDIVCFVKEFDFILPGKLDLWSDQFISPPNRIIL